MIIAKYPYGNRDEILLKVLMGGKELNNLKEHSELKQSFLENICAELGID